MKVLIITPCGLPVPAVKGGAVLTLIDSIINQNELMDNVNLNIISSYDEEAYKKSKNYKKTSFIFIKKLHLLTKIDNLFEILYKKVTKKNHKTKKEYLWKIYLITKIKKILLKENFDKIIFENSGFLLKILKNKSITQKYKNNIFFHIHNDIPDNIDVECLKKCKILSISKYLKKKYDLIVPQENRNDFIILKNGFNCERFLNNFTDKEKNELKTKLGFDKNDKIIIFAGRITEEKGILQLTRAFKNINDKKLKLLVVGSHRFGDNQTSEFMNKMNKMFKELGNKVIFTGYIDYNMIWKYYKIADVAILPSIWEEPAGLTMLEASVCEIPVVTTYSGGIPEYITDKYVTFLKNDITLEKQIEDAILEVSNDYEKYKLKAKKAKEYVSKNYNETIYYENFCQIMNNKAGEK